MEKEEKRCHFCEVSGDDLLYNEDIEKYLCKDCNEAMCICSSCEDVTVEAIWRNDDAYCPMCFKSEFFYCSCGAIEQRSYGYTVEGSNYCEDCFSENFFFCAECGEIGIIEDSYSYRGDLYCRWCYEDVAGDSIVAPYDYKPAPIFHKFPYENTLYMGVELEYDYLDDAATTSMRELDPDCRKIYFKRDLSVSSGFEIVSHPMTLAKHREFGWKRVIEIAKENGGRTYGCGLHIHLQKCSTLDFIKMKSFFWQNRDFIFLVSGRKTKRDLERWADVTPPGFPREILKDVKEGYFCNGGSRYSALNPTDYTIEVRIFKSTEYPTHFYAALEFCYGLYYFVKTISVKRLLQSSCLEEFLNFIKDDREFRNLKSYFYKEVFPHQGWQHLMDSMKKGGRKKQCA